MRIQIMAEFVVVAVETDGLNGDTGNTLCREEESQSMPRIGEKYSVNGSMHDVFMVEHHGKRLTTAKHCQVLVRVNKVEFAALKQYNTWCSTAFEALRQGIV